MTPEKGISLGNLLRSQIQDESEIGMQSAPTAKLPPVLKQAPTTTSPRQNSNKPSEVDVQDEPWKQNARVVKAALNARVNDEVRADFKRLIRTTEDEFRKRVTVDASVEALVTVLLKDDSEGELRKAWKRALWELLD